MTEKTENSESWDDRTVRLLGEEKTERLRNSHVLVVGVGGVGGYAAEMLARSGVGHLTLVDADNVATTNLNRQIIATVPDLGKSKVELFAKRFREINPDIEVIPLKEFLISDSLPGIFEGNRFGYVIDAIDTVAPKVALIVHCLKNRIPIISSMGAGGRVDVTKIAYLDIWETREDGLARAVRQKLKALDFRRPLKCVASTEKPQFHSLLEVNTTNKLTSYGTLATVPATFGIFLANHVILKLAGE